MCVFVALRAVETKKKAVQRISEQLMKLEVQATDREENKQIALGTSKLKLPGPANLSHLVREISVHIDFGKFDFILVV